MSLWDLRQKIEMATPVWALLIPITVGVFFVWAINRKSKGGP